MSFTLRAGGALFLSASSNKKLSPVVKVPYLGPAKAAFPFRPTPVAPFCCSTYTSIDATCPDSCRFKRAADGSPGGCYVDAGKTVFTIRRLDREGAHLSGDAVTVAEADLIDDAFRGGVPQDGARGGRDLRLHVGGDTSSEGATEFLAAAAGRWLARSGGKVWTFTHRWQEIHKRAWGPISVLASVESPLAAALALGAGYAPALVVTSHLTHKLYQVPGGEKFIPCPAETKGTTCVECRLCLNADALVKRRTGIAFALHGAGINHALVRLGHRSVQQRLL